LDMIPQVLPPRLSVLERQIDRIYKINPDNM
jgi:hypothetical protein